MKNLLKLFEILFSMIFLLSILFNKIECYYVLPLKTTYDYNKQEAEEISKKMHNFLTNNIYTELTFSKPSQKLSTFIKSKDYCSYIGSYLCNLENSKYDFQLSQNFKNTTPYNLQFKDFDNVCLANEKMKFSTDINKYSSSLEEINFRQFYHAPNNSYSSDNPYTCGVFGFRYKLDESIKGEDGCINLINGLFNYSDLLNKNKINNQVFSINYSKNDKNIDGKLIIGNYPHEYDSNNYAKKDYIQVYLNETSLEKNNDFHTTFYNIYFYRNNKIGLDKEKIEVNDLKDLHSVFILEQNMFMVPKLFFDLYVDNFFQQYINEGVCEILPIDLSRYNTMICYKNKISSLTSFYETFPTIFFFHFEFNSTFEFTRKELLIEDNGIIYFMLFTDSKNNDNFWGIGKIFMEKYLLTFDYGKKSIGYYFGTEKKEKKEFNFFENGIYVILILGANILVIISCALFGLVRLCTKRSVDPTIMIESFSNKNIENLKENKEDYLSL